jgi:hypothetical protein
MITNMTTIMGRTLPNMPEDEELPAFCANTAEGIRAIVTNVMKRIGNPFGKGKTPETQTCVQAAGNKNRRGIKI